MSKSIYALYDKRANAIYEESITALNDYRQLEASYAKAIQGGPNIYTMYPADFKIVKVGEVQGGSIHIFEEYQTMVEMTELLQKVMK